MAYTGQGLGYSRLTVPEDGLSQSLQFWGAEAGKRKAAADLENERERVRTEEKMTKASEASRYKFNVPDSGFDSFNDNYRVFSRDAANHYNEIRLSYLDALNKGQNMEAEKYADQMEKIKMIFEEQKGSAEKLKGIYDTYAKMDAAGTLSDFDKHNWKMVKGLYNNDSKATFLNYNRDDISSAWFSSEVDENGEVKLNSITMGDINNGMVAPLEKIKVDGKEGLVDNYVTNIGTYTKDWYVQGKDRKTKGYNEFAKAKLDEILNSDLDTNEIKDLAAQFNIAKTSSEISDPAKYTEVKKKVIEQLKDKILAAEDVTDSTTLNLEEARLAENKRQFNLELGERRRAGSAKKAKTEEEIQYGSRRANVENLSSDNPDSNFFKSGTFTWGGKPLVAVNSDIVGDRIVITTDKGKKISVNRKDMQAVNSLFDAFENPKKPMTFDKVMKTEPYMYREFTSTTPSRIIDYARGSFDDQGKFNGNHGDLLDSVKEVYPDAKIDNVYAPWSPYDIRVNGVGIKLKNKTADQIESQISKAVGNSAASNEDPEGLFTK